MRSRVRNLKEIFQDPERRAQFAREKFRAIARRYDLLIRLLSLGLDGRWRALVRAKASSGREGRILDVATGTGRLARPLPGKVVGIDFCLEMLLVAKDKGGPYLSLQRAEELAFKDNIFDACTMGVALRHMGDVRRAIREMVRVTRPGGRVVIADYSLPRGHLLKFYFFHLMPLLGLILTFNKEIYLLLKYLPHSVASFYPPQAIARMMEEAGLYDVEVLPLGQGIVSIWAGVKNSPLH